MSKEIVLATGNPGKVRELQAMLEPLGMIIRPQSDFDVPEADETGLTFAENALIKARNATQYTGLPAIADDSGLCVDALGGAPGIYSARYSGPAATDDSNIDLLLKNLSEVENRHAHFHCTAVFLRHAEDPDPIISTGRWHGQIIDERRGENGFGYDPVFLVGGDNRCSAELPATEKNQLSHRGQALLKLVAELGGR